LTAYLLDDLDAGTVEERQFTQIEREASSLLDDRLKDGQEMPCGSHIQFSVKAEVAIRTDPSDLERPSRDHGVLREDRERCAFYLRRSLLVNGFASVESSRSLEASAGGYRSSMDRPSPRQEDLWAEALWGVALIGTILLVVAVIAALGH
jgi:hypothetical protein